MNVTYVPEHVKTLYAANTVTYNLANDVENFNKEMASDSLEWHVMQSPNENTGVVFWPAGL
jgi:lipid II:glycine glycyltransferase (peptidoglycan interpeptide bridge formation enzyme)